MKKTGSYANLYFSSYGGTYEFNVEIKTDQKSVVTVKVKKLKELTKWKGQLTHDEDSIKRIIELVALPKIKTKVKEIITGGVYYAPCITLEFDQLTDSVIKDIMYLMDCTNADYRQQYMKPKWVGSLMETS